MHLSHKEQINKMLNMNSAEVHMGLILVFSEAGFWLSLLKERHRRTCTYCLDGKILC